MNMKRILNILGYISLLTIPYIIAIFILILHRPVKIISIITLIVIILIQIKSKNKNENKNIGVHILTTLLIIFILTFVYHNCYGFWMNKQAKNLLNRIERIDFENYTIDNEEIKNANIKFVNEASIFTKGTLKAKIYYLDGNSENINVLYSTPDLNSYMYEIDENIYYIRVKNN